jgi:ubiquinone/menaquinone biosynthesis C-methylase UbiE
MQQQKENIRLNLGCGLLTSPDWVNVDGSWNARLAKHPTLRRALASVGLLAQDKSKIPWDSSIFIHDIRKPLPFPDGSATAVYASHVLEHLYFSEGQQLLRQSFRVLRGGGILRVVVPDLNAIVREYLGERPFGALAPDMESLRPGDRLNERLLMRSPAPTSANLFYRIYEAWEDFHTHKWMYDADSLSELFRRTGFVEVQSMECHVSRIADIQKVEDPSRIRNCGGFCIEGLRPSV